MTPDVLHEIIEIYLRKEYQNEEVILPVSMIVFHLNLNWNVIKSF
jgi:hypothetical protein